jgi:hypothetical protein
MRDVLQTENLQNLSMVTTILFLSTIISDAGLKIKMHFASRFRMHQKSLG